MLKKFSAVKKRRRPAGRFLCARETVREFKRRGVAKDVSCSAGKILCISLLVDGGMTLYPGFAIGG